MSDDYSGDILTTGRLLVGQSSKGIIEPGFYDMDWFKISLVGGQSYVFKMSPDYSTSTPLRQMAYTEFYLYDSKGQALLSTFGGSGTAELGLSFVAGKSGDFFLAAGSYNQISTGGYLVSATVQAQPADDFPANLSTTGVLALGQAMHASFDSAEDADWFKFHAEVGKHYSFSIGAEAGAAKASSYLIYDADGTVDAGAGGVSFEPMSTGDYFISIRGASIGTYDVTLKERLDDYSSNDSSPGQLAPSGVASGVFESWLDSDRFKFSMQAGHIYTFDLSADAATKARLIFFNGDDASLGSSLLPSSNGIVRYSITPATSGLYSINVAADYTWTGSNSSYTLTAISDVVDDYGNDRATAAPLQLGKAVSAIIQSPTDIDLFKVDLQAGTTYAFSLKVDASSTGAAGTVGLNMSDSNSVLANFVGSNSTYTPSSSGTYYLAAGNNYSTLSQYSLSVSVAPDDVGANVASAGHLSVGGKVSGALEAGGGDRDWYGVALAAGSTYWFTLAGAKQGGGTLSPISQAAQVRILDSAGNVVAATVTATYDITTPVLSFVPAAQGNYYVEVSAPDRSIGTYQLQAALGIPDDVGGDIAHASAMSLGVSSNGVLELPNDKDMYKLSVIAGTTYALQVQPGGTDFNWPSGLNVAVFDGSNTYIQARNFSTNSARPIAAFEATTTGDVYVVVSSTNGIGTNGGKYTLTSTSYGLDDFAANKTTAGVLPLSTQLQANISYPDDKDWVKVHLEAGRTYEFDMLGARNGGGTLDTALYGSGLSLYGSSGERLAPAPNPNTTARLTYVAKSTGDYYLEAHSDGKQTGSYTLVATQTSTDVTAPVLSSITPVQGAGAVGLLGNITLSFSELVVLGNASSVTLTDANGVPMPLDIVATVPTQTLVFDPKMYLQPGMSYTLNIPAGVVLDLAGNKTATAGSYTFSTLPAATSGGDGNDYLVGSGKGMSLNGGAGIDTVYYDERAAGGGFNVARSGDHFTVRAYNSGGVSDTLTGVERLLISGYALALDVDGNGGQAYRLYKAAFHRVPDSSGLGFWMAALDGGTSLRTVAQGFVDSNEFKTLYGAAPSDADFVKLLYNNVLGRAPDQQGSDYWIAGLHNGASRADILVNFSESPENQSALLKVIGNGFAYTPYG